MPHWAALIENMQDKKVKSVTPTEHDSVRMLKKARIVTGATIIPIIPITPIIPM